MAGGVTIMPPVSGRGWPPDPLNDPQFYHDVTSRRVIAFIIDFMAVAMILIVIYMALGMLTVMTLGLAHPLLILFLALSPLIGMAYHALQVGSPAAGTIGMRLMGLKAWSVTGGPPTTLQGVVHALCYYGSVILTSWLICLVALFNARRQTVHDMVAGIVVLRAI